MLGLADRVRAATARSSPTSTLRDGILYGVAQAFALIPGVSRSGATITAGLFPGLHARAATRFSFLLSIPAVLAVRACSSCARSAATASVAWGPTLVATVVGFVVGYAAIAWLLRCVADHSISCSSSTGSRSAR